MKAIPFTQFLLPNGRQIPTTIDVDDESFAKYQEAQKLGFRMTSEILRTGAVSMCIEDRNLGDYDMTLCTNGQDVHIKLKEMLMRFDPIEAQKWIDANLEEIDTAEAEEDGK